MSKFKLNREKEVMPFKDGCLVNPCFYRHRTKKRGEQRGCSSDIKTDLASSGLRHSTTPISMTEFKLNREKEIMPFRMGVWLILLLKSASRLRHGTTPRSITEFKLQRKK